MRPVLAQLVDWRKINRNGELVPAHPPMAVIKSILATPDPALPVLAGIVTTPVFGRDGELITGRLPPGGTPALRPAKDFVLPVAARPTSGRYHCGTVIAVDDLLGEFPFTGEAERAHHSALLLVGFVRALIDGPTRIWSRSPRKAPARPDGGCDIGDRDRLPRDVMVGAATTRWRNA